MYQILKQGFLDDIITGKHICKIKNENVLYAHKKSVICNIWEDESDTVP
jgi:hypothetical protein